MRKKDERRRWDEFYGRKMTVFVLSFDLKK
jgi:hypothetical protein